VEHTVGRTSFDRRIFLPAGLKLNEDVHPLFGDPSVVPDHIALLLQVGEEIDELYPDVHVSSQKSISAVPSPITSKTNNRARKIV
jgi:hypothetical protein